jgi:hypothetical protein
MDRQIFPDCIQDFEAPFGLRLSIKRQTNEAGSAEPESGEAGSATWA